MGIIILTSSHSAPLPDTQTFGFQQILDLKYIEGVADQLQAKPEANVSIQTVAAGNCYPGGLKPLVRDSEIPSLHHRGAKAMLTL